MRALIFSISLCFNLFSQTKVDLGQQGKNVDFSGSATTKPIKTGTVIPASCSTGELFFKTNAVAGSNLFACVAANTWFNQSSAGGVPTVVGNPSKILSSDGVSASWLALGGDISGAVDSTVVNKIQNRAVSAAAPAAGQALVWNAGASLWEPRNVTGGGGSLTWESAATAVGSRPIANLLAGTGLLNIVSDTGSKINIQQSLNTAVVLTRTAHQAGTVLFCNSTTNSAVAYRCVMNPTLTAYTMPLALHWRPDVTNSGGAMTLEIDGLGARTVKLSDGVTDPSAGDIKAGVLYPVWYDGVLFRLLQTSTAPRLNATARPVCDVGQRGQMWHIFGTSGVKDTVSVCAKDAAGIYDWRSIY